MRIRVWNAFASNNSGSYTIVGSFGTRELAAEVAAELVAMMQAHTAWRDAEEAKNQYPQGGSSGFAGRGGVAPLKDGSPLELWVKQHGLTWHDGMGTDDDWPQYSKDNVPQAFAIDNKVIIHHDYTVTLPRVFGQYFYARGGRVDHELNHAHHPIVALFELYVPWQERKDVDIAAKVAGIVAELNGADGPLVTLVPPWHQPAWQTKEGFGEADLTLGAVFEDLMLGFSAVHRIATSHGLRVMVKIFEAFGSGDSLTFLRPSAPAVQGRLCSVVLEAVGDKPVEVTREVAALLHGSQAEAARMMAALPATVMTGLVPARAERVAEMLREAGATASTRLEAKEM